MSTRTCARRAPACVTVPTAGVLDTSGVVSYTCRAGFAVIGYRRCSTPETDIRRARCWDNASPTLTVMPPTRGRGGRRIARWK